MNRVHDGATRALTALASATLLAAALPSLTAAIDTPAPGQRMIWDAHADFLEAPDEANPSPDRYGNAGVWSYLWTESLDHDPAQYRPMEHFTSSGDSGEWRSPYDVYYQVGTRVGRHDLAMHTGAGRLTVLAWTSPIDGQVSVDVTVEVQGGECTSLGSGVIFSMDVGAHVAQRLVLPTDGAGSFVAAAEVRVGDAIYFILDPGTDTACDTTFVDVILRHVVLPDTALPDTAVPPPTRPWLGDDARFTLRWARVVTLT